MLMEIYTNQPEHHNFSQLEYSYKVPTDYVVEVEWHQVFWTCNTGQQTVDLGAYHGSFTHGFVWKRSGAWFYKALPKHIRPVKDSLLDIRRPVIERDEQPVARSVPVTYTWAHSKVAKYQLQGLQLGAILH
ncbi:hypothetical protein NFI96_008740 [Prochilodus magdalenae]|nr:hypothetical protein NFI96_008740 [Prochilodus magdalenae]